MFSDMFRNHLLMNALLAWATAQILKFIIYLAVNRSLDWDHELFLGFFVAGIIVRVVLHGQLAVSLFDLRVGGRLGYTQHFVVITFLLCHNPITSRISSNLPYIAAHCRFQYRQPQADLYKPDRPANGSPIRGAGERQRD